jgi:hypothetical protein
MKYKIGSMKKRDFYIKNYPKENSYNVQLEK